MPAEFYVKIIFIIFLAIFVAVFGSAVFHGAPFAPSKPKTIARMLQLAGIKAGERACDIGSGDGRIVIALARAGAEAVGIEKNIFLVWWSRLKIKKAGLADRAKIIHGDLWKFDFSKFSCVTVFGIIFIMKDLEKKLQAELKPGARVVSNLYTFPTWQLAKEEEKIYLYQKS